MAKKIVNNILELVGKTPMVCLNRMAGEEAARVWAKLEAFNPGGSIKDRIALSMIEDAERRGILNKDSVIVEPTSGNTGVGLAMVAAVKGYHLIITMPETMSMEHRYILKQYGADVLITPASEGMAGAVYKAEEIAASTPGAFMPQQFKNPANPEVHRRNTALEIIEDTEGKFDVLVAGVGTGGTITGLGEALKERCPRVRIVAVEPAESPVLSAGKSGPHCIPGIGAGFVPEVYNGAVVDEVRTVSDDEAYEFSRRLAKQEGILAGISAGAAACVALGIAGELGPGKTVVVILPDTGSRYLSLASFVGD